MKSPPVVCLPGDLSADDALQVAWLIRRYRERAHTAGSSVSTGLLVLERAVAQKAMQGQPGSTVEPMVQPRKAGHVNPLLIAYEDAAVLLGFSLSTLKRRIRAGEFTPVRDRGIARLGRADIDDYIARHRGAPA